jgi:hypothetical protein
MAVESAWVPARQAGEGDADGFAASGTSVRGMGWAIKLTPNRAGSDPIKVNQTKSNQFS